MRKTRYSRRSFRLPANLYLIDLLTGARVRITHMAPGQYALYPHFRSDGWIYFLVMDNESGREYVGASDAALRVAIFRRPLSSPGLHTLFPYTPLDRSIRHSR